MTDMLDEAIGAVRFANGQTGNVHFVATIMKAVARGELIRATPAAIAASPEGSMLLAEALLAQRAQIEADHAALIREAEARGMERAADVDWSVGRDIKNEGPDYLSEWQRGLVSGLDAFRSAIRALAPASGVAKLEKLRAERDADKAHVLRLLPLATERDRLAAELDAAHDKYQRDVFGLNNEGDPIGGDPPSGLKQRADKAEAELAAANAREAGLRDFIGDFANAKIDALRYQPSYGESPEDEPDPVVDAETVWAWQADAKAALSAAQPAGMAGKGE